MIRVLSICFLCLVFNLSAYSQGSESIASDRPGQALSANTVGKNTFQLQTGFDYSKKKFESGSIEQEGFSNTTNFRYGLTSLFEVGLDVGFLSQSSSLGDLTLESNTSGINTFAINMRYNVLEGDGASPAVGVFFGLGLPWGASEFKPERAAPKIYINTAQSFGKGWGVSTNWGLVWDGNSNSNTGNYVINLNKGFASNWMVFIEHYAEINKDEYNPKFDFGLAYLVNDNLQLDIYSGFDSSENLSQDHFLSLGLSWRPKTKE